MVVTAVTAFAAAGLAPDDVVNGQRVIIDMSEFTAMNAVYERQWHFALMAGLEPRE